MTTENGSVDSQVSADVGRPHWNHVGLLDEAPERFEGDYGYIAYIELR